MKRWLANIESTVITGSVIIVEADSAGQAKDLAIKKTMKENPEAIKHICSDIEQLT